MAEDVKNSFVDFDSSPFISNELHNLLKNYQTKYNDVLLTIVGNSIGDVGIVKFQMDRCNLTENCAKICNTKDVNPDVLFSFLKSKYGQLYIEREKVGSAQPKLSLERIRNFRIPIFNKNFQNKISSIVNHSYSLKTLTKSLYQKAENILLEELGLKDWKPKHQLTYIKNYSDTQKAERFDAEYFQPKYDELIEKVKNYENSFLSISEIAITKRGSLISDKFYNQQNGKPYIRGADFSSGFLDKDKMVFIDKNYKNKQETIVKEGDIVFALIGSVGKSALIEKEYCNSFISNNIGKISLTDYSPFVLQILLNSRIGKLFFEKIQMQTAQPKISDNDIHSFIVPNIKYSLKEKIENKYKDSQKFKSQSKNLLEIAKKAVEMAIEDNEEKATNWIDQELEKLGVRLGKD